MTPSLAVPPPLPSDNRRCDTILCWYRTAAQSGCTNRVLHASHVVHALKAVMAKGLSDAHEHALTHPDLNSTLLDSAAHPLLQAQTQQRAWHQSKGAACSVHQRTQKKRRQGKTTNRDSPSCQWSALHQVLTKLRMWHLAASADTYKKRSAPTNQTQVCDQLSHPASTCASTQSPRGTGKEGLWQCVSV